MRKNQIMGVILMAVTTDIRGTYETLYEGCVITWYEVNGYHDSDWYAEVWDEKTQSVQHFMFMTTRAPVYGRAEVDITPENLRKVYRYYFRLVRRAFDEANMERATTPEKGKRVRVVKGRKVPIGTEGVVFWIGDGKWGTRAGIQTDEGERVFVPVEYLEVLEPEKYLIKGKERRKAIRIKTLEKIPEYLRGKLVPV